MEERGDDGSRLSQMRAGAAELRKALQAAGARANPLCGQTPGMPPSCVPAPFARLADGTVYLTFDDGPGERSDRETLQILDTLAARCVGATFFVLGAGVARFPATLCRMVAEGHTVGSHSYDHSRLIDLTDEEIRGQMRRTAGAVRQALGGPLPHGFRYCRPPFGAHDARVKRVLRAEGYDIVLWDVDSLDWQFRYLQALGKTPSDLADWVIAQVCPRQVAAPIVLLHSTESITVQALPAMVDRLEQEGYHLAALPCDSGGAVL